MSRFTICKVEFYERTTLKNLTRNKTFMASPLIVTAKMDDLSFDFFDRLRRRYFPPERNFLSAHITLFHHLPGEELSIIQNDLKNIVSMRSGIRLCFSGVRFLGRGVAVEVNSSELVWLREKLANRWLNYLTAQDRQKFKPHITVQNKIDPETAKILYEKFKADWREREGISVGLQLWFYCNGPWKLIDEFMFEKS